MRIGIYSDVGPRHGGVSQYAGMVLEALAGWGARHPDDELTLFAPASAQAAAQREGATYLRLAHQPLPQRAASWLREHTRSPGMRRALQVANGWRRETLPPKGRIDAGASRWIRSHGTELLFFPSVTRLAVETDVPSIIAVHDIQHRLQPHFPEYSPAGLWEELEYTLTRAAAGDALLVAESETGREDLLRAYTSHGLTPDRVMVVPYGVPSSVRGRELGEAAQLVRQKFSLPARFLFYPALFLPHKNHVALVEALGIIGRRYAVRPTLVLVGDNGAGLRADTFRDVMETARRVGVEDQLRYLGYVGDEELGGLFAAADLMVMPSYFGPTNLPILEAWGAGCPVLTSDLRGIREMCGDAALLVDPAAVDDLAEALAALWVDAGARAALVARGTVRVACFSPERYRDALFG
ncbi:MAG: glycosyltransferase family 1 protein, partial [Gemmatimonadaceae bacterium]